MRAWQSWYVMLWTAWVVAVGRNIERRGVVALPPVELATLMPYNTHIELLPFPLVIPSRHQAAKEGGGAQTTCLPVYAM